MDRRSITLHQMGDRAVDQLLLFHATKIREVIGDHPDGEVARTSGVDREIATLDRTFDRSPHLLDDAGRVIAEDTPQNLILEHAPEPPQAPLHGNIEDVFLALTGTALRD